MSCSVPMVVAKQSFLGQSTSLGNTAVFTPAADGDFIVALYVNLPPYTVPSGSGLLFAQAHWTDPELTPTFAGANATTGYGSGPWWGQSLCTIHAKAGNPIEVSAGFSSGDPSQTYDLYVTVIQI